MGSETRAKRKLRELLGGWSDAYEPGRGSGVGYPDLQFLVDRHLLPLEVKVGVCKNGIIFPSEVRASQISWHGRLHEAGGISAFVVCCDESDGMDAWVYTPGEREKIASWRKGWPTSDCLIIIHKGKPLLNVKTIWEFLVRMRHE